LPNNVDVELVELIHTPGKYRVLLNCDHLGVINGYTANSGCKNLVRGSFI